MSNLYPLKFDPIFKGYIWGGTKLKQILGKDPGSQAITAESWEISAVEDNISVVTNGFLAGNNLQELIEIYMGDLVGDRVYEKFGIEFPILIKFIDANNKLSIQVHPDDELAVKRNLPNGKTEMWYVLQAEEGASLISGFNRKVDKDEYQKYFNNGELPEILNYEKVSAGDVFNIPAGRIHAIGSGILLAEIQQTSDATYRIYDWERKNKNGKSRELHTELAIDAIDYNFYKDYKTAYKTTLNKSTELVHCEHFNTNLLKFNSKIEKDYSSIDSFIIYMCTEGSFTLHYDSDKMIVKRGETILLPAVLETFQLEPKDSCTILEIYL